MEIKDLPIEIQEIVFKRQTEQGNKPNNKLKLENSQAVGNFDWNETIEGGDFWSGIDNEYYLEFYEKYPKKEEYIELNDSHVGKLVSLKYGGKFYDKVLVTKDKRNSIHLLNNCYSNADHHSDKTVYKYSLFYTNWVAANICVKEVKLLPNQSIKEENMETKFKIGDKVKIINRHPDNTTGSNTFNKKLGMIGYVCEYTNNTYALHLNKDGTGDYYGLLDINDQCNSAFKDSDLKLITEEELPTELLVFGQYKIGDIVVSLDDKSSYRKKGDLFKVLPNSLETHLYYEKGTSSTAHLTWRKATKKEEEAYNNGIKNIKDIISIDTYGLNVGDFLPVEVICQWANQGFNYNQDKKWEKKLTRFISNRKILSFKEFDGVVGFEVSDTSTVYLRAEGFKEFMDNFDKPKKDKFNFIENKWYEVTKTNDWKYIIQVGKKTDNAIYFHIGIDISTKKVIWDYMKNDWCFVLNEIKSSKLLTDLSEIQQYLPDNHPDKIKTPKKVDMLEIQEECKKRFPIGCKYLCVRSKNSNVLLQDSYTYTIQIDNQIWAHAGGGLLYDNGVYATLVENPVPKFKLEEAVDFKSINYDCLEKGEIRLAKEDEKKWFEYCRSIREFISFKEFMDLPNSRPSVKPIESKNENQSFKIKTKNSLLDTSIEKVPTITSELKQKSKTIKF